MEKMFNKNESLSNLENELQKKIAFAKEHALSDAEYENLKQEEEKMQTIQDQRELTDEEVNHFYSFREKLNESSIEVETLVELKRAMDLLRVGSQSLVETIAHENAHGNKAEELGATHHGYHLLILKGNNGEFYSIPKAILSFPDEWDINKKIAVKSKSLKAPEDYGREMSDDDKEEYKKLNP